MAGKKRVIIIILIFISIGFILFSGAAFTIDELGYRAHSVC